MSTKLNGFQVLLCITNNLIKHQSFIYTHLNDQTVLFQTIHHSISKVFFFCLHTVKCKTTVFLTIQFSISTQLNYQTVLFDPKIGPYQVITLQTRVDIGVMAVKRFSVIPKASTSLKPHIQIF